LERSPDYSAELLSGGRFRHKDDAGRITIGKVDILTEHNEVVYSQVEAIIQDAPPLADCARNLAAMVSAKTAKLGIPPSTFRGRCLCKTLPPPSCNSDNHDVLGPARR
jgi:hypothetical protein